MYKVHKNSSYRNFGSSTLQMIPIVTCSCYHLTCRRIYPNRRHFTSYFLDLLLVQEKKRVNAGNIKVKEEETLVREHW